jgi:hypothetical protein
MSKHSQHKWTLVIVILGAVLLGGCAGSEQAVSSRKKASGSQVETAERAARTEDPGEALRLLQNSGGRSGPVLLTLEGILLAETSRYARAVSAMKGALRLVGEEKGLAAEDADLPRFRPTPKQKASGDLPVVTAATEKTVVKTLRRAVNRSASNEELLRALKERPIPVRWPPLYEGGAGLALEMLRQHFGDETLRMQIMPYRPPEAGEGAQNQATQVRRRIAAQNLIVASILARDAARLKRGREALRAVLSEGPGEEVQGRGLRGAHRSALHLALADYLLDQEVQAGPLPQKARRLFRPGM